MNEVSTFGNNVIIAVIYAATEKLCYRLMQTITSLAQKWHSHKRIALAIVVEQNHRVLILFLFKILHVILYDGECVSLWKFQSKPEIACARER